MRYFSSLALSALHFHAAGWLPFSQSEWNALHKGHNKHLKRVTLMHFGHSSMTWSAMRVQSELGVSDTEGFLREARLRFCSQLISLGEPLVWALLQQEQ